MTQPDPDGAGPLTAPQTNYVYDADSQLTSVSDPLSRVTSYEYDHLGRLKRVIQPDPDGAGPLAAPSSTYAHNVAGNLTGVTDPLGKTTNYEYDHLHRKTKDLLPDPDGAGPLGRPTTTYHHDAASNLTQLTDPVNNDTVWAYDGLNRVLTETNELGHARTFEYNAAGRLTKKTDRNGRVTEYTYDNLQRLIEERWKNGAATINTQIFAYNAARQLTSASDTYSSYTYTYDSLGRVTLIQSNNGGPQVKLLQEFDAAGRRTKLSSQIAVGGGSFVDDFWTGYTYDNLGHFTRLEQNGVAGGHSVHQKRVDFAYNAAGQTTDIDRYWALAGGSSNLAASTDYTYDGIGRLTNLAHAKNATTFASYTWAFDAHSRLTSKSFTSLVGQNGSSTYTYDNTDQLTATDHSFQTDEAYAFDENGNRTMTGYTTGTNNRLTSDGTFNYTYDNEGNRLTRTRISGAAADDYLTEYTWDHHNRLTKVTFKNNSGTVTKEAIYTYNVFDRRIKKSIDADGAGAGAAVGVEYVYDGGWDIQLAFNGHSSLTNRYLHGPGEDNILADEQFTPTGANQMPTSVGSVLWPLTDNLGSVRDIIDTTGSSVVNHITYDAFGKVTSETNAAVNHLGGFQGAERDEETGMQLHDRRFFDPATGRWIKEDPIGFSAGDTNLARMVGNGPTNATDPSGLDWRSRAQEITAQGRREAAFRSNPTKAAAISEEIAQRYRAIEQGIRDGTLSAEAYERHLRGLDFLNLCLEDLGTELYEKDLREAVARRHAEEEQERIRLKDAPPPKPEARIGPIPGTYEYGLYHDRELVRQHGWRAFWHHEYSKNGWDIMASFGRRDRTGRGRSPVVVVRPKSSPGGSFYNDYLPTLKAQGRLHPGEKSDSPGSVRIMGESFQGGPPSTSRPSTLRPGPHSGESIPARGPGRDFTAAERRQVNDIGRRTGCHTCGTKDPGTKSGDFVPDHQPPNALNRGGGPQQLLPHCLECSRRQGGEIRAGQQP